MSILTMNLVIIHKFLRKKSLKVLSKEHLYLLKMNELVTKCCDACLCTT